MPLLRRKSIKTADMNAVLDTGAKTSRKAAKKAAQPKKVKPPKPQHPKAKITFRHNILPPLLGVIAALGVLGLFNAQWVTAQAQYMLFQPDSSVTYSAAPDNTDPDAAPQVVIPKINVEAPLITTEKSYDEAKVQQALQNGVVQYGASVDPGQAGNVVVLGHSSGQLWAPGDYKFVFTMLDKLEKDDRILVDFKGKRYIYRVSDMKVVPPTDLSVLEPTTEPQLTLITCTPVGTDLNRLIVTARQVSPNPETATPVDPESLKPVTAQQIPN